MIYDLIVVGAGVAGCTMANYAHSQGKKVLIVDRAATAATGGSGAAGAFISPKLGKENNLLKLTNIAFNYAHKFYSKNYSQYFDQSGIVRVPKDAKDEDNLQYYQSMLDADSKILNKEQLRELGIKSSSKALFFKDGGVCDAQGLCKALIEGVEYKQLDLQDIKNSEGLVVVNSSLKTKKLVLATGYEGFKNYLKYMGINGLWGSRGDFYTDSKIDVCVHKDLSVSANCNGVIKIGATHIKSKNPCMQCNGKPLDNLVERAKDLVDFNSLEVKEVFCGMRSGSRDFFPTVGKIIDHEFMLTNYPEIKRGYKKAPLKYIENIYVFNGLGGRGFVFAPLMAKWLYDFIFNNIEIDPLVNPDRLFLKWARKYMVE